MIVGIDEVGRGCWAGPLVAGAVVLSEPIAGLRDSKKLSKKQRQHLDAVIRNEALDYSLGWVQPIEIDELGLTRAVELAMRRALAGIDASYDQIIIDGNINYFPDDPRARAIVRADDSVPSVSAASIIAKVARDEYMIKIADELTDYDFDKHVGYGTALHRLKLDAHGPSRIHRLSYRPVKEYAR